MEWSEIGTSAWRAAVAFGLALAVTRYLNKQVVARLTYFDFTLGAMIGVLVGHIPNDYKQPFWPLVIPTVVVLVLGVLTGWSSMRIEPVRHFLQGKPTVLIQNGKVQEANMRSLRYNLDQLNSQLRASSVFDIGQVEFAMLEPGGQLSVLLKSQYRSVTPADLKLATRYEGIAIELIMDGKMVQKNLQENALSEDWLRERLAERGILEPTEVFYAVLNSRGQVFFDLYRDELHRPVDIEGNRRQEPENGMPYTSAE